jgi:hypothetical protein
MCLKRTSKGKKNSERDSTQASNHEDSLKTPLKLQ